jgi:16S rRNA (adenine(1408)-N(1))-methyltransferase
VDELFDDLIGTPSNSLSLPTGEGVVIDIGTGDGAFENQCARENPNKFYIGIDANPRPLEKVSERIHRKPAKGGVSNVLFIQAAIENLPPELDGVADEVHIHFPWGTLLRVVATGDKDALRNLRRVLAPEGVLEIIIGLDPERDRSEIERLGLEPLSADFLDRKLAPRYQASGFEIVESGVLAQSEWPKLRTSWAKRLRGNEARTLTYIIAHATEVTTWLSR